MRTGTLLVALALVGGLGAPRALAQAVSEGESRCAFCHRPANGPGAPGCPQAATLHAQGGGGGDYDPDAELRGAARDLGTALGQALGEELFGGPQRAYEAAAAAAAAEAAQRALEAARLELSNQLRSDWDARDAEHSRALASIFEGSRRARAPRAAPPPRSSGGRAPLPPPPPQAWLDPGVVDLRGTVAGGVALPALEAWSRVDAVPLLRAPVGPRFAPFVAAVPPPPPDGWPGVARARDLLLDEAKGALKDELLDHLPDGPKRALEAHLAALEGTLATLDRVATEGVQLLAHGTPAQVEALAGQLDRQDRSTFEEVVDKAAGDDGVGGDLLGPVRTLLLGE